MAVPYTFGAATAAIPLSQLDSNFASTITLGDTAIQLGNTVTILNNMTFANVTISSGSVTITNVTASGNVTISGGTANGVAYLNSSKILTTGTGLVFDGTNLGIGTNTPSNPLHINFDGTAARIVRGSAIGFLYNTGTAATDIFRVQSNGGSVQLYTTGGTATLDTAGNLGLGVTPSAWGAALKVTQFPNGAAVGDYGGAAGVSFNYYNAGAGGDKYIANGYATRYLQTSGQHQWYYASNNTSGANAALGTFTQAMTLDASGNLGVGTPSPASKFNVADTSTNCTITVTNSASNFQVQSNSNDGYFNLNGSGDIIFRSGTPSVTERARIDSSGNLYVNYTGSANFHIFKKASSTDGTAILGVTHNGAGPATQFYVTNDSATPNAANTGMSIGRAATTRSINAAGTINAAGLDYAEYMIKANSFALAKGDVVGINADGKLTNVFADAVSFVVKSTNPSYVGGDTWGTQEALGLTQPETPSQRQATEEVEAETDEEFAARQTQYEADKAAFEAALEAARQTVDRIAFAGQVPVNVTGATAGQYIVPVNDNGAIKGEAVSNPTFEQYQQAVGKVIAIEQDGRARIIVKVA